MVELKAKDILLAKLILFGNTDQLNTSIEIRPDGEPDSVIDRTSSLIINNPSSLSKFLFNVIYSILSRDKSPQEKDIISIALIHTCNNYVYADYNPTDLTGPPVLISPDKLPVSAFIIRELVEPITGSIKCLPVFFVPCNFTDPCRIIEKQEYLEKEYRLPKNSVNFGKFPVIVANCAIHNSPAILSALTVLQISQAIGEKACANVCRSILLDRENLLDNLIVILKTLRGEPDFVIDFLEYFSVCSEMTKDEITASSHIVYNKISQDHYMLEKLADVDRQVNRQWSQWSMLLGLIEKQLSPMRGSMWPVTETVKPFEDKLRLQQRELAKSKKKKQLTFEELLETARDLYGHNAVEPGKIVEHLLKDDRVWK